MHSSSIDLNRARDQLPRLIEQAARGDEVILTEGGEPVARIIPIARALKPRQFGSARGTIHMAEDRDAPLEDIWMARQTRALLGTAVKSEMEAERMPTPEEARRSEWHARLRSVGIRPATGPWPPPEFEPMRPRFYRVRRLFWPLRRYIKRFL